MKKLLAVLLVAFIALGAVFAEAAVNPTSILLKYHVKENNNVLLRNILFMVGATDYEGVPVVVSTGEGSTGGIDVGNVTITVLDASKKAQPAAAGTKIKWVSPTKWKAEASIGGLEYSNITADEITILDTSTDGVTVAKLDGSETGITISYGENKTIDRSGASNRVQVANWKLSWTKDESAPAGDYTATITVEISPLA